MSDELFFSIIIGLGFYLIVAISTLTPIKTTKKIINKIKGGN